MIFLIYFYIVFQTRTRLNIVYDAEPIQMPPNEKNEDFVSIQVSKAGEIYKGIFISVPSFDKPKN